jgi:hypothetical protein
MTVSHTIADIIILVIGIVACVRWSALARQGEDQRKELDGLRQHVFGMRINNCRMKERIKALQDGNRKLIREQTAVEVAIVMRLPFDADGPGTCADRLVAAVEMAGDQLREAKEELEVADATLTMAGDLLRGVAVAIKGDPGPNASHSHHDLPDLVAELMEHFATLSSKLTTALNYHDRGDIMPNRARTREALVNAKRWSDRITAKTLELRALAAAETTTTNNDKE